MEMQKNLGRKVVLDLSLISLLVFCLVGMAKAEETPDPSLIGWWKFDETEGDIIKDSSIYNNHGKMRKTAQRVRGKIGNALTGRADVISQNTPPLANEISVEFWVYWKGYQPKPGYQETLLYATSRVWIYNFLNGKKNAGKVMFAIDRRPLYRKKDGTSNYIVSNTALTPGKWQHVAGTFKDGIIKIYIDGRLDNTKKTPYLVGHWWEKIEINPYSIIDELKIYNRALTAEEIAKHANLGEETRWQ